MSSADLLKHDDFGSESEDDVDFNPAPADDSDQEDAGGHGDDDRADRNKRKDEKARGRSEDDQTRYESDETKPRVGRIGKTDLDEDEDGEGEPDYLGVGDRDNDGEDDAEGHDDDDDEDDEDDEEDEDEELEGPRRKRRRDRRHGLRTFIDVEAEVDEEEDELEEEDEDFAREADGFIADTHPDDLADLPAGVETDDRRHRQLDRQREREAGLDAEKQAEVFKQRYGRSNRQTADSDAVAVPKRLLLPSVEDPSIWGVRCKPGKEREVVFGIMKRIEERAETKAPLGIISAFERGGTMAGYVYIEARKWPDILIALEGLSNIYPRTKNILVDIKEMPDLLRVTKTKALEPGAYVRIKRGKYQGDVAQVDAVETNGLEVLLRIVPRLDYGLNEDANAPITEGGAAKRKRPGGAAFNAKNRPPQRLFSEAEARKRHAKYVQRVRNGEKTHWTYLGDDYDNGYLMKEFKIQYLDTQNVNPSLEEVTLFASGADDGTENLDLNALAINLRQSQASGSYVPGDVVEVYEGEQQGVYGKAVSVIGDIVSLMVLDGELKGQTIEVPIKGLRKRFREGDHVKVIGGSRYRDEVGMVVRIKDDRVTILTDTTMQEITVFSKDLREAADSGNSGTKLSHLELHDLVALSPVTVACVLKVDREALQVIDQDGNVRTIMPSQISNFLTGRKNTVATDRNGSEIRVGDTVREATGEHRQGVILHIYRAYAFLHDRESTENGGVFPVRTNNVTTVAAKGGRAIKSAQSVDLTKMNPALLMNGSSNGSMQPPPRSFGRDRMLGKTVKIRTGQFKGVLGIIKDTTDTEARVELHTKAKIINVPKDTLKLVDPITGRPIEMNSSRSAGPSSGSYPSSAGSSRIAPNWEGGRTPQQVPSSGSRTPAWGVLGRTPAWNSGGRTPGWKQDTSGGRTPAYGDGGRTVNPYADGNRTVNPYAEGARTAYGGGNKTPAWNPGSRDNWNAGSKTPAYGGDAWGSKTPAYSEDNWGNSVKTDTWAGANAYDAPTPGGDISAPTPGALNAPTPGNYSAPTPAASAPTPRPGVSGWGAGTANTGWGESAPTPAAQSAPTPGASHGGKAGRPGYYDAPTPAGYNNPQTPGNWGGPEEDEPRYSTPSP